MIAEPGGIGGSIVVADIPEDLRRSFIDAGYSLPDELLINAFPEAGFNPSAYEVPATVPTMIVDDGDVIDLGDRAFEVLHLPGHSPGSIGLWEEAAGILFSGDALYDGPLLDEIPGSDIGDYIATMERIRALPVEVVHGGHDPSFGRVRMLELTDDYLTRRR